MPNYKRNLPDTVDAIQLPIDVNNIPDWVAKAAITGNLQFDFRDSNEEQDCDVYDEGACLTTAHPGDWIIKLNETQYEVYEDEEFKKLFSPIKEKSADEYQKEHTKWV